MCECVCVWGGGVMNGGQSTLPHLLPPGLLILARVKSEKSSSGWVYARGLLPHFPQKLNS
jgi:hypothetical protein